ncbi:uncharacterized protein K452DRAFT_310035 [Aplosporella prunicola CBS 121167]|uniref:F-box domain-containing protein n=1 Tax=Aplosporella prunicola CBS 121167 TaxID=1176127 RepID=A0A6A6BBJ0_9PEZI|nr:uncharacterized protein K452DRAFT_310035 [Aplosporella prunicola CBS 121167]KAF2140277.1 hypothetical protein K452DRAFT_310035 [Aplosporella prunicola CBS 121167]
MMKRSRDSGSPPRKKQRLSDEISPTQEEEADSSLTRNGKLGFLDLPGEIRNMIYKHALCRNYLQISSLHSGFETGQEDFQQKTHYLSNCWVDEITTKLLLANKTVHAEAASLLYGNRFDFCELESFYSFIVDLRPETRSRLRHIRIVDYHEETPRPRCAGLAFDILKDAPNLESLTLKFWYFTSFSVIRDFCTVFFEDSRTWLETVAKRKGSNRAAVELIRTTFRDDFIIWCGQRHEAMSHSEEREYEGNQYFHKVFLEMLEKPQ